MVETTAGSPLTQGECFAKLLHHIREAQEQVAALVHLANANDDRMLARGWLSIVGQFKKMEHLVTQLATKK
jgi:hypothetical protein